MFRIDHSTAAAALPTPGAAGTPGYFTEGNPGTGTAATVVTADWANMLQEELMAVILDAGLTPSKTNRGQLLAALGSLRQTVRKEFGDYFDLTTDAWTDVTGFSQAITVTNAPRIAQVRVRCEILAYNAAHPAYLRLVVNGGEHTNAVIDRSHVEGLGSSYSLSQIGNLMADVTLAQNTTYTFKVQARNSSIAPGQNMRFNASQDHTAAADPDAMSLMLFNIYRG